MWKLIVPCALLVTAAAGGSCKLPGPAFPAPREAARSAIFDRASKDFLSSLNKILYPTGPSQAASIDPDLTSFAVEVYSARDSEPLFAHYHTATTARNNTVGVNEVDRDTVFRIGSISKLWTVLLLLLETGDALFNEPVTKYIPELRAAMTSRDEIDHVQWDEVTIGTLASQMAGVERSYGLGDLCTSTDPMLGLGFPQVPDSDVPVCGLQPACSRSQYFAGLLSRHPIVPVSSTPAYSNDAYQLLGYVLESITGKPVDELLEGRLINPLGLTHSYYSPPADHTGGIIPGSIAASAWDLDLDDLTPAGGMYSSAGDLSTIGRAILNHELLPPAQTRRWMKPVAYATEPNFAVGAPWEIVSLTEPRLISLYTKSGDLGGYSALVGLSPDHGVGFTILVAGGSTNPAAQTLGDLVSTTLISSLEGVAKEEAKRRFAGTYTSADGNSSITIRTDHNLGLRVTQWTNNGKDMFDALRTLQPWIPAGKVDLRLYPTGLESPGKISFRSAVTKGSPSGPGMGPFTKQCKAWMQVDGLVYGSVGLDEFVFHVGDDAAATSVSPRALRVSLHRVGH
ncbi:beta-lactamase/transpeptidase-like protein [Aspergillus egyptiacus]|nr:beta-lactamase/transpeptidase-like protein [Aspergillus egyptiacus]